MARVLTRETVVDYLKSLGKTPDAIAAKLEKDKITGWRNATTSCPLAVTLKKQFENEDVWVFVNQIVIGRITILPPSWPFTYKQDDESYDKLPPLDIPFLFIQCFDSGRYPKLNSYLQQSGQ